MAETKLIEVLDSQAGKVANTFGVLSERVIGGFALSIGTSLAFESIFESRFEPYDPDRKIPDKIYIGNYDTMWINLGLLFRNIFSALPPESARLADAAEYADSILFEMNVIEDLLANEGRDLCKPIFYYCSYKKLRSTNHGDSVRMRTDDTPKKQEYRALYTKAIEKVLRTCRDRKNVLSLDSALTPSTYTRSLVLTQYAYDLLSADKFKKLDLLESYTGVLKPKHLWYTKYYKGKSLTMLPFTRKLLYIFGDHELFHPMLMKFREVVIDVAKQRGWSPLTSEQKVDRDFRTTVRNIHLLDVWKKIH